jgi:hypothetical protein
MAQRTALRTVVVALVAAASLFALSGCFPSPSKGPSVKSQLEQKLVAEIDSVTGAYVWTSSSGFGNTELTARLYMDTDDQTVVTDAVDNAFRIAWTTWPSQPVGIRIGVVLGDKPAEFDYDEEELGLGATWQTLHMSLSEGGWGIHAQAPGLEERYGAWVKPESTD